MFSESLPHLGGGKITDGIQFTFIIVIFFFKYWCTSQFEKQCTVYEHLLQSFDFPLLFLDG